MSYVNSYESAVELPSNVISLATLEHRNYQVQDLLKKVMKDYELEVKALEDFIVDYGKSSELPAVYHKLVRILNEIYERVDDTFFELQFMDVKSAAQALIEVRNLLDNLGDRITLVRDSIMETETLAG